MEGKIRENVWWLVTNVGGRVEVIINIHNVRVIEYGPDNVRTFRKAYKKMLTEHCIDDLGKDYLNQMKEDFDVEEQYQEYLDSLKENEYLFWAYEQNRAEDTQGYQEFCNRHKK